MTIDEYVEREIAALRRDFMQVGDSYTHPLLAEQETNEALIEEIEASLLTTR